MIPPSGHLPANWNCTAVGRLHAGAASRKAWSFRTISSDCVWAPGRADHGARSRGRAGWTGRAREGAGPCGRSKDRTTSVARAHVDPIAAGCAVHELYEQTDGLIGDSILSYD